MGHSEVERCELAPGLSISRVLTGLWQLADMERDDRQLDLAAAARAMNAYVGAGLTTFDMADHYGSAEDVSGIFLEGHGGDPPVQMLTKWVPKPGPLSRADVRAAIETALGRLKSDRLDLLQFHSWNYADPSYLDGLFYLRELQEEGLIHHLGMTNTDAAHLGMMLSSGIEIVSNQVSFSLLDQRAAGALSKLCLERGIKLLAYGTLAGGLLTERYLGQSEPDIHGAGTWSEMKYKRFLDVAGGWDALQALLSTLDGIARRHQASIANVASRYILDQPAVGGVIVGARLGESEHIEDNLRLFQLALDERDRSEISAAIEDFTPIPGDCGDEYRRPPFLTATGDLSHHIDAFPPPFPVVEDEVGRSRVLSGTHWETIYGYSRAVREGDEILVSGTTASHGDRLIGGDDATAQTHFVIDKIEGAIQSLGGTLADVVRTRVFVPEHADWEAVAAVHGERFGVIKPANTLVRAGLVGEEFLVEMEADARLGSRRT
jgi:aryl-alcohol dehydrogenase-like predicted oxidoreductase/enamine deaminase RidA (YjgF/YER057c/UK114 family)